MGNIQRRGSCLLDFGHKSSTFSQILYFGVLIKTLLKEHDACRIIKSKYGRFAGRWRHAFL